MGNSLKYIDIRVSGNDESLLEFIALCRKIHLLCNWGACRVIPVVVDGDGNANLRFEMLDPLVDEFSESISLQGFGDEVDGSELSDHWIGE